MFEVSLTPIGLDVEAPSEESLENGAQPLLAFKVVAGSGIPMQAPNGQPVQIPAAIINFPLNKEQALEFAQVIVEQAEKLPDVKQSDFVVAQNMSDVEKVAQQMDGFTRPPPAP